MQAKNLRNRIFVPTMLSILILLGVFAITAFLSQERDIKREVETKLISVEDLFTTFLDINASMMGAALNAIMRDRQLTAAFREKDRESLYNQSRPLFEQLRSGYGITHFYFTDSSRVNLLRVHQQDRYGDRIDRFTTLKAEKTGKLSYGIELGPLGTFTLRVVIPWHDEGRLIGYVELGMEIEQIIDELHKVLGVELYIFIEKKFLDRQDWEASMKMLGRDPGWDRLPFEVLTAGTMKIIPEEFVRFLSKKQHLHKMSDKKISFDGQIYLTKYLDLKDAAGRSVGDLVILNNVTKKVSDFRKLIFLIGVSCLGIGGAMFIFFYVFLGRVEKQLLETQRRVLDLERDRSKFILDNLPEHISIIDQNGCFAQWNTYSEKIFGHTSDEAIGRLRPEDVMQHPENAIDMASAMKQKGSSEKEIRGMRKDGTLPWLKFRMVEMHEGDGTTNVLTIVEDITSRRQAEMALRESKEKYKNLYDEAPVGYLEFDTEGRITNVNKKELEMLGYTYEEMVGQYLWFFVVDEEAQESIKAKLSGKKPPGNGLEPYYRRKDGSMFPVLIDDFLVKDESGCTIGMRCINRDITEIKQKEEELQSATEAAESANRLKSEFLANMSHEIRTPMNGIIGMTGLVLGTDLTGDQRKYLEMAKISADTLLILINDILDFSKIETGKMALEAIDFNLRVTLENAADSLALKAQEKGLELVCHILPDVPTALIGDPGKLRQIIVNMAGNSLKFTEEGEIVIRVEMESETDDSVKLHFMVSDTGIGIPQDKLDSIFRSFEQVDGSTTRKYGGTGLGLSITRQLVEMMGGEIRVESPNRYRLEEDSNTRNLGPRIGGPGSIFHFTICFELSRSKDIRVPRPKPQDLSGMPVLIVDDNTTNRILLQEMITSWGLVPTITASGKEAIDRFNTAFSSGTPYRLILLDVQMPELDGFEVAKIIKDAPSGKDVRIILLSSMGLKGDSDRCKEIGISGYLPKPIKQTDLFDAIMMTMGLPSEETSTVITSHKIYEERERFNILLAEDNLINQTLATRLLETRGHRVTLASNGVEVVEAFKMGDFDLILMDIQMPKMDGFEATRAIRDLMLEKCDSKGRTFHIPIIAMTAHAMTGDREKCIDAGMDDYVSKPIKPEALYSVIDKVARKS